MVYTVCGAVMVLLTLLPAGCARHSTISFLAYQPPDFDVSLVRTVTVLPLEAQDEETGRLFTSRLIHHLTQHGYFSVIEADPALASGAALTPEDAVAAGQRLGVDGVIVGTVEGQVADTYTTENNSKRMLVRYKTVTEYESQPVEETVKVRVKENGEWVEKTQKVTVVKRVAKNKQVPVYEQVSYTEKYLERGGTITAHLRLVDVATGNILASRSATHRAYHRKLVSTDEPHRTPKEASAIGSLLTAIIESIADAGRHGGRNTPMPDRAVIAANLAGETARELADQLSPRRISVVRTLQKDKTADRGVRYARNGQWDQAGREWRRARDLRPENSAVWNNLGVFYEHTGQYAEAQEAYEQATARHPDNRIARQNLSALNTLIAAMQKQTATLGAKIEKTSLGLLVSSVLEGTLAERLGLRRGDIIDRVNRKPVGTLEELEEEVVLASKLGGRLEVDVTRAGETVALHLMISDKPGRNVALRRSSDAVSDRTAPFAVVDVDQVVASKTDRPDALGVIMGIEDYRYAPGVPFARHDALVAHEYFVRTLGLKESNIYLRTDRDATQGEFRKAFDAAQGWLAKRIKPEKTEVFVYFTGHGVPDPSTQDAYLIPADGDPNYPATGYRLDELYQNLGRLPARQVTVLIDACFSGQVGRSERVEMLLAGSRGIAVQTRQADLPPHMVVLTAAQGNQVSSSYPDKSHGLFTYFVLKGLQGHADQNTDSAVTVAELYAYVRTQVQEHAGHLDREQTPDLRGSDVQRVLVRY
jgi:tetratricopeptide (TPR) repeat protein